MLLKLKVSIALILVEFDERKWRKHLVRERGKLVVHATCNKGVYGAINAALLVHKKMAKEFKIWGFTMNTYDTCA